jgi:RIO kinase 1
VRNERMRRGKRRFDDDDRGFADKRRALATARPSTVDETGMPDTGDRWSTWDDAQHGPQPYPSWVVTELSAVDTELGVLKTGKEADVHLIERAVPGTGLACVLAAKRYRGSDHRLFHRDSGYLEGRRVRKSRELRAMANRTAFGREVIAAQWAVAEFAVLSQLWSLGAPVPYPVQLNGTELLLEFIGSADGQAAPRLAQLRPDPGELHELWRQLVDAMVLMAGNGLTHGDLSAYNLLVNGDRLVVIDLPQVVDVVSNPRGPEFLHRDVQVISKWFAARGLLPEVADPTALFGLLKAEARLD